MKIPARFLVVVTLVIALTDAILFVHLRQHPRPLTITFLVLVILVTVLPIYIIAWFWSRKK